MADGCDLTRHLSALEVLEIAARVSGIDTAVMYRKADMDAVVDAVTKPSATACGGLLYSTIEQQMAIFARAMLHRPAFPTHRYGIVAASLTVWAEMNDRVWRGGPLRRDSPLGAELRHRLRQLESGSFKEGSFAQWLQGVLVAHPRPKRRALIPEAKFPQFFLGRPDAQVDKESEALIARNLTSVKRALSAAPLALGLRWHGTPYDAVQISRDLGVAGDGGLDDYMRDCDTMRRRSSAFIGIRTVHSDGLMLNLGWAQELDLPMLLIVPAGTATSTLLRKIPSSRFQLAEADHGEDIEIEVYRFLEHWAHDLDDWARRQDNLDLITLPVWSAVRQLWGDLDQHERGKVCAEANLDIRRVVQMVEDVRSFRAEPGTTVTKLTLELGVNPARVRSPVLLRPQMVAALAPVQRRASAEAFRNMDRRTRAAVEQFFLEEARQAVGFRGRGETKADWRRVFEMWLAAGRPFL